MKVEDGPRRTSAGTCCPGKRPKLGFLLVILKVLLSVVQKTRRRNLQERVGAFCRLGLFEDKSFALTHFLYQFGGLIRKLKNRKSVASLK